MNLSGKILTNSGEITIQSLWSSTWKRWEQMCVG